MRVVGVSMAGALAALVLSCATAFAEAPTGLEPGVHVAPGSPAAKEYALPLNQARHTGAPSTGRGESSEATLFGAGIKPPGSGGSRGSRSGSHGTGKRGRAPDGSVPVAAGSQAALPAAVVRAARTTGSGGSDGSLLVLLGGGILILVLGGFGGTVLRHSRRPTSFP